MEKENNVKEFLIRYKGAIIGAAIAILVICTGLFRLLAIFAVIAVGVFIGHYVQNNKDEVKEKLKEFIDKF
ncbi:MAG: DUF2273 domain-containing protein [Clostridia bacterium]|jgi:uncharacterized membrane protein|nr:DUF2273 domain-containing protein [Clostridia bacterium]